jgi:hypothetical protein
MNRIVRGACGVLLLLCHSVARRGDAQTVTPAGSEFLVNVTTTNSQLYPSVATDSSGGFVVVWRSKGQDGAGYGVFGQRRDGSGALLGAEFRVNSFTTADQDRPAVASAPGGAFTVAWQSDGVDGDGFGIAAQRYAASGAPLGSEFVVNTTVTNAETHPAIGMSSGGDFVVVWQSFAGGSTADDVFGQRYSSLGSRLGGEFRVNTYTSSSQASPGVAFDASGNFVVVWGSDQEDGQYGGVFGQRYSSSGAPLGGEFRVNAYTTNLQAFPAVAWAPSGSFVVVWHGAGQDGSYLGIFGQRYSSLGSPSGTEFRVNTQTTDYQSFPVVASDASGGFVVAWQSFAQDGSGYGVFGQRYASTGARLGSEFRVSTFSTGDEGSPAISSVANGDFVVAWQSGADQDGDAGGVFGQRYCVTLTGVSIGSTGSTSVCPTGTGGMLTVTDVGGGSNRHQWGFRTVSMSGGITSISMQTGASYTIHGSDFPGVGTYFVVCTTMPNCGSNMVSNEITVTVASDVVAPTVSAPGSTTVIQTLCQ